jgi:hypothetical protein
MQMSRSRPKLARISDHMRHLSALLGAELLRWPKVRARPMFGMRGYYRGRILFAMLPEKRGMENPFAIAYKLATDRETTEGQKWKRFELASAEELDAALGVLGQAYRRAGAQRSRSARKARAGLQR